MFLKCAGNQRKPAQDATLAVKVVLPPSMVSSVYTWPVAGISNWILSDGFALLT